MELYTFVVAFFRDGGVFLYPMAVIFVVGIAIAVERFVVLTSTSVVNRHVWEKITPCLKVGNLQEAMKIAEQVRFGAGHCALLWPVARPGILPARRHREGHGGEPSGDHPEAREAHPLSCRPWPTSACCIGLLGTIVGLISAFGAIATANPADKASLLSASISVAMNNTAGGLIVAITLLSWRTCSWNPRPPRSSTAWRSVR